MFKDGDYVVWTCDGEICVVNGINIRRVDTKLKFDWWPLSGYDHMIRKATDVEVMTARLSGKWRLRELVF